ncbi:polysaccharide biosynthesis/export family protein [Vampirovibrio sp.]|uniref:polysaccharide biosynthesis/export family protein n=1 Tax=Vampirovibrio sp. TaxID=2717857 RepID=UPI003593AB8E
MTSHRFISTCSAFFKVLFVLCAILFTISPFQAVRAADRMEAQIVYQEEPYLLGPGDVISLQVADEEAYSNDHILIGPDGHAHVPGVGDVYMKDRTMSSVTHEVLQGLKRTLVAPEFSLSLEKTKPCIVYLSGAVMKPGRISITTEPNQVRVETSEETAPLSRTDMYLSNVLANAGGVQLYADLSQVQIKRAHDGQILTVNLWGLLKESDIEQDIRINSGDSISIPALQNMALDDQDFRLLVSSSIGPKTFPIRVLGEVEKPGVYLMDATSPYLNTALAQAGGFSDNDPSNRREIAVRRFSKEDRFSTFFVPLNMQDLMLRPNDVVYVPESTLHKSGRRGMEIARILSPFQTVAQTAASTVQVFGIGGWKRTNF